MSALHRALAPVLLALLLLAACGYSDPAHSPTPLLVTATVVPPTAAPVQATGTVPSSAVTPPAAQPPSAMGVRMAFYSERDGNAEIYSMRPDGSDQRRLTTNQFEDTAPAWSPDGSQIAFISDRDDPQPGACFPNCFYQLYAINADGSGEHRLAETEFTTHHPDWHPDGTRLSFDTEFNLQGDLYLVKTDGSGLQRLIEDGFWADWSPDGNKIAFASNRDGNVEIYVADADGSNQRRLTTTDAWEFFPAWSPDGTELAYFSCDPGCRPNRQELYIMSVDGGDVRRLTDSPSTVDEDPAWSPDGKRIAFQSNRDRNYEIYTMKTDGSDPQRLTDSRGGDYWPSFGALER